MPKEFEEFVNFCTSILWPIFHDVTLYNQSLSNPRQFSMEGLGVLDRVATSTVILGSLATVCPTPTVVISKF